MDGLVTPVRPDRVHRRHAGAGDDGSGGAPTAADIDVRGRFADRESRAVAKVDGSGRRLETGVDNRPRARL